MSEVVAENGSSSDLSDPYRATSASVREPPKSFVEMLGYIGPGFILSASIVGSGELIATTLVGAKAGFILMWFIILSCVVKVVVQLEFGKRAIATGESTMASFNQLPGPRFGKANWSIWTWLLLMAAKMLQLGGIVGGVVLAIGQFFPAAMQMPGKAVVAYVVAFSVSLLVFRGYYTLIEKASLVMIGGFTLFTLASLLALQTTDMAITGSELASGLVPSIPPEALLFVAIGAFGITGVGGDEIMAYNYWLIEKGYAAYTGPRDAGDPNWERRAKGWIRVMKWDAVLAMLAYTFMTVMFYLLGAAVLNRQGTVPKDDQLIETLGTMYTAALGPWARSVFVVGAVIVLYSTLFAALAAWTRMFSDAFGRVGLYDFTDGRSRRISIAIAAWVLPLIWATLAWSLTDPGRMVILGGLATVVILLIVEFAALYFRYFGQDARLKPSLAYDIALWVSSIAILLIAVHATYSQVYLKLVEYLVD